MEDYTSTESYSNFIVRDITRNALGALGIEMYEIEHRNNSTNLAPEATAVPVISPKQNYPAYDGRGNATCTIAGDGTVGNEKRYDAWGAVRANILGPGGQVRSPKLKHCSNLGHKYDATSGLTYMHDVASNNAPKSYPISARISSLPFELTRQI